MIDTAPNYGKINQMLEQILDVSGKKLSATCLKDQAKINYNERWGSIKGNCNRRWLCKRHRSVL